MKMKNIIPIVLFASAPLAVCAQSELKSGIDLTNLDNSVRPADDFYQYACGGWMKKNPLPAAYSRYGSFDQLGESSNKRVNAILKDLQSNTYPAGSTEQKLSDFYKLAMDSVRRNKEGVKPLMPLINEMESAKTVADLRALQLKHAKENIMTIYQGGLALGQKE